MCALCLHMRHTPKLIIISADIGAPWCGGYMTALCTQACAFFVTHSCSASDRQDTDVTDLTEVAGGRVDRLPGSAGVQCRGGCSGTCASLAARHWHPTRQSLAAAPVAARKHRPHTCINSCCGEHLFLHNLHKSMGCKHKGKTWTLLVS